MRRCNCLPPLDDWKDGHPDAWDYDAVLKENGVTVEWCDTLVDGNGNEHQAGDLAGGDSRGSMEPTTSAARPTPSPARPAPYS